MPAAMKKDPSNDQKLPPPDPEPEHPEPHPPIPDPDVPDLGPDVGPPTGPGGTRGMANAL